MEYLTIYKIILLFTLELQTYKITAFIIDDKHNLIFADIKPMHRIVLIKDFIEKNNKIIPKTRRKATIERYSLVANETEKQYFKLLDSLPEPPKIERNEYAWKRSNTDIKTLDKPVEKTKYTDVDSKMKNKLLTMMDEVVRYSDFMVNKVILVKPKMKENAQFEMGTISMTIYNLYDDILEIARTMDSSFTEWSAMEHINGYDKIHKMTREIIKLTSELTRLNEGGNKELNTDNLNFDEFPGSNKFPGRKSFIDDSPSNPVVVDQGKNPVARKSRSFFEEDGPSKISLNLFLDPSRSKRSQSSLPDFL